MLLVVAPSRSGSRWRCPPSSCGSCIWPWRDCRPVRICDDASKSATFRRAFEALARDDYEFALLAYEQDVELRVWGDAPRALGLAETYNGRQGFRDFLGDYKQDMNNAHWELEQIVDLGDRLALRSTFVGTGALSGVTMRKTIGIIWRISPRGTFTRQDLYWTWDESSPRWSNRTSRVSARELVVALNG